jgi:CRP-like cAMP-binding protein
MYISTSTSSRSADMLMTDNQRGLQVHTAIAAKGYRGKPGNNLLDSLACDELEALEAHLERVALPSGKVLFDYGNVLEDVYFPTTAVISLLYVLADGATTEIAVVGHEGVAGVSLYQGETANCCAVVHASGHAWRLKSGYLRAAFAQGGVLPELLMRATNTMFAQMVRGAASGRHSSIEQKLSRWLLERLDRAPSSDLKVTQSTISILLGVRRESITAAAGKLQELGLIASSRGKIAVIDREGLEAIAGEYYAASAQ